MGLDTLIISVALIVDGIVQALVGIEQGAFIILGGVVGLVFMLYAQFKYIPDYCISSANRKIEKTI